MRDISVVKEREVVSPDGALKDLCTYRNEAIILLTVRDVSVLKEREAVSPDCGLKDLLVYRDEAIYVLVL